MSFYLKPPRGDIALEKLEDLTIKRWEFLQLLTNDKEKVDIEDFQEELVKNRHLSEAVMENSSKDRVSHYFLRLSITQIGDYTLKQKFISGETRLFHYRLVESSSDDTRQSLCEVVRHIDNLETNDEELNVLGESIVNILSEDMLESDQDFEFPVPFQIVPNLVASRKVVLKEGQAMINKKVILDFLVCVFAKILKSSMIDLEHQDLDYGAQEDDQRISILVKRIKNHLKPYLRNEGHRSQNSILADEVDQESHHFPLCFARVHQNLQKHHRLGHHARVAYTLFLKEIGLSLEEAFKFWSHYYSKPTKVHEKCSHSWQENHRKFDYSLNHLYGQAGGRKDYSAHSCSAIGGRASSVNEELTCAFMNDIEDIDPRKQCASTLKSSKLKEIHKPSEFYNLSKQGQSKG